MKSELPEVFTPVIPELEKWIRRLNAIEFSKEKKSKSFFIDYIDRKEYADFPWTCVIQLAFDELIDLEKYPSKGYLLILIGNMQEGSYTQLAVESHFFENLSDNKFEIPEGLKKSKKYLHFSYFEELPWEFNPEYEEGIYPWLNKEQVKLYSKTLEYKSNKVGGYPLFGQGDPVDDLQTYQSLIDVELDVGAITVLIRSTDLAKGNFENVVAFFET